MGRSLRREKMHINSNDRIPIAVGLSILAISAIAYAIQRISQYFAYRKRLAELRVKLKAEEDRIEKLPKLDTRWLIKVPDGVKGIQTEAGKQLCARTFGTRYNRLLVVDEKGEEWVGLFMPETLQGLRDGEYVRCEYFIPFRGAGERDAGKPVFFRDHRIHNYPMWMEDKVTTVNEADWEKWFELMRAQNQAFLGSNHQEVFRQILPLDLLEQFRQKRRDLDALTASLEEPKKK